ncbi:MAG: FG-GAP-like repeat-containing protein [Pseudomonadales bacterium]
MTFGVLFAAALLTLFQFVPRRSVSTNRFFNVLKGGLIGAPLGVCVNCTTPIAYSMYKAGFRLETALATLTAAPTLNVVVLTMLFSLLPLELALIKLLFVILFIVIVIPILTRFISDNRLIDGKNQTLSNLMPDPAGLLDEGGACTLDSAQRDIGNGWLLSIKRVGDNYCRHLWVVIKMTVPLMIIAGIIGSAVIEALPIDNLLSIEDSIPLLIITSLLGALFPVPIAFDVIVVSTLLSAGFPVSLSMALLFSLGIFSIYPALLIAKNISYKLSIALFFSCVFLAVLSGSVASKYSSYQYAKHKHDIDNVLSTLPFFSTDMASTSCDLLQDQAEKTLCDALIENNLGLANIGGVALCHTAGVVSDMCTVLRTSVSHVFYGVKNDNECLDVKDDAAKNLCRDYVLLDEARHQFRHHLACNPIRNEDVSLHCRIQVILDRSEMQSTISSSLTPQHAVDEGNKEVENLIIGRSDKQHSKIRHAMSNVVTGDGPLSISYIDNEREMNPQGSPFEKISAAALGVDFTPSFNASSLDEPFLYGRGIASGDINNDGFPDLVFSSSGGVHVYVNTGENRFIGYFLSGGVLRGEEIFVSAMVDINNDGWLDLFLTSYGGGNFLLINKQGRFNRGDIKYIAMDDQILSLSIGIADKDRDGDLDIYLGQWSYGLEHQFSAEFSDNWWLINSSQGLIKETVHNEVLGETLSVLLSDINQDSFVDLIIGNDSSAPTLFYYGSETAGLNKPINANHYFPITSYNPMSLDSADFNNDARLDLFSADMAFGEHKKVPYCSLIEHIEDKKTCDQSFKALGFIQGYDVNACLQLTGDFSNHCLLEMLITMAKKNRDNSVCNNIPDHYPMQKRQCILLSSNKKSQPKYALGSYVKQVFRNKLLIASEDGTFIDVTKTAGVGASGWAWNSKAADLDNDEWLDIYSVNGLGIGGGKYRRNGRGLVQSNVFFHNQKNGTFLARQKQFGLEDYLNTSAYTYVDIDLDGDLDIVTNGVIAKPRIYINQSTNNSLMIDLRDQIGNRYCIGCKVIIYYGENDGKKQLRELKLSGGFMSFDEPVVHFGLGNHDSVSKIEVFWSNGGKSTLVGDFSVNRRYKIERLAKTMDMALRGH